MRWACFTLVGKGEISVDVKKGGASNGSIMKENPFKGSNHWRLGQMFTFQHRHNLKHKGTAIME